MFAPKISRRYVTAEPSAVLPLIRSLRIFKCARISAKLRFNAKFIHLPRSAADEILPPVVSCAWYLLVVHARHGPAGFFVSVVWFAYRVYASWTSIRLPRAVAARPSRYAYFCAVSHASAASASRLHRVFQKHENLSYYNFRFFAASPAANCRCAVSLPALAVPASSFSARALKF